MDAAAERGGDGTRQRPLRSLGEALARPGPLTVYLVTGEYRGPFEVSSEVRLEGQGDATVLSGDGVEGPVVRVAVGHEVLLRNLSVRGGKWGMEVSGGGRVRVEQVRVGGQGQGAVRVTSGRFEAATARFETSGETVGVLLDGPTDGVGMASPTAGDQASGAHERMARVSMPSEAMEHAGSPTAARLASRASMSRTFGPLLQEPRLADATFRPVRQEARLSDTTFTGPFRRAVRVRGLEARATLEDVRFQGAVTAVGMDGGHAEIRRVVAEGGQGAAFSVVEGVMVLEDARVSGYEVGVSAMRAPRLEVHGLLSVGATRAGISVGASSGVRLEDVVVRDSGSHGALHLTGSEVEVQRLRVEGSMEYGVVAVGGRLRLRNSAVVGVRSNDGITGEGLHLRQVHAEVEGVLVRDTAGACVLAVQNARVTLRDAELARCGQSALSVDTRARMDAMSVEAKDIQQTALAAMDGGELRVDALVARTTRQGLVSAECTGDTRVRLGRVRAEDVRGVDAWCVERLTKELAPAPR
ncbi:hypothetical protein WA016_02075 [Myxococcus stipitatus]